MARIVVDPVTRIEGHLRIEAEINGGAVSDAWSSGTMFRGIELILRGRDPREAWIWTQRICGVCTTVHALASVRAVEDALGIEVPENASLIRNIIGASQYVQDHVIHFYHLHALDWVDVTLALKADPGKTSQLAESISPWPKSSRAYFKAIQDRVKALVESKQLSLFSSGYWGHPAYHLPPEANLLAVAHYVEALEFQKDQALKAPPVPGLAPRSVLRTGSLRSHRQSTTLPGHPPAAPTLLYRHLPFVGRAPIAPAGESLCESRPVSSFAYAKTTAAIAPSQPKRLPLASDAQTPTLENLFRC